MQSSRYAFNVLATGEPWAAVNNARTNGKAPGVSLVGMRAQRCRCFDYCFVLQLNESVTFFFFFANGHTSPFSHTVGKICDSSTLSAMCTRFTYAVWRERGYLIGLPCSHICFHIRGGSWLAQAQLRVEFITPTQPQDPRPILHAKTRDQDQPHCPRQHQGPGPAPPPSPGL